MKKLFTTALVVSLLVLIGVTGVNARAPLPPKILATTTDKFKCPNVEKVDKKIINYNRFKDKHLDIHERTKDKLIKLADKLTAKGYDTATFKNDIATFDVKIDGFKNEYETYIEKLTLTKDNSCDRSNGKFMGRLNESKRGLVAIHRSSLEIRNFFVKTIKKDILEIKKQKLINDQTQATSTPDNATSTVTSTAE